MSQPDRVRRSTAVSRILQAIREAAGERLQSAGADRFRIRVAADRVQRERAYALAAEVYRQRGYAPPDCRWIVAPFDTRPQTFTLLAEDDAGRPAATLSLVFDEPGRLPCDELYADEAAPLRTPGRRLGEVVRLAIAAEHRRAQGLFLRMINLAFIYGRYVQGATDCLIEVTPNHARFYCRFLGFTQLGDRKPNPRVEGTTGVLLHLDMDVYTCAMAARRSGAGNSGRLYDRFLAPETESEMAARLAGQHRPMTPAEAQYFGIAVSVDGPVACMAS